MCILAFSILPHTSTLIEVDRKEAIGFVCRQFVLHVVNLGLIPAVHVLWMYVLQNSVYYTSPTCGVTLNNLVPVSDLTT